MDIGGHSVLKKHRGIFTRIRHLRGHGIHSPFVYSLVRSVFIGCCRDGGRGELYDALRREGVASGISRRIQRLYKFCGYGDFSLGYKVGAAVCVILPRDEFHAVMAEQAPEVTFVIVAPYSDKFRIGACLEVVAKNESLTIDTRQFFIIFNHCQPPKQHFKI